MIKEVTVASFNFTPGYKGSTVKALIALKLEGSSSATFTHVDLTDEESEEIIEIARSVEYRLGDTSKKKELELQPIQEKESLHNQVSQRYNNLFILQEQAAKYGAGQIPLPLQNEITDEENAIADLEDRLKRLDR